MINIRFEKSPPIPPENYVRVRLKDLMGFVTKVFKTLGFSDEDSRIAADVLVTADLFGIHSHGVQRLKSYYYNLVKDGVIRVDYTERVVAEGPSYAIVDAGHGLGHPISYRAMMLAVGKAKRTGVAVVTVKNSTHFGIAGYYALKAAERGVIGFSMTNSIPFVAHTGAMGRALGTNPIAVSFPTRNPPPILIDMATSVVPMGKIQYAARVGKKIPEGWGLNKEGVLTTDPNEVINGGYLLPLGGLGEILGGHKGYGLALIVEIMTAGLTLSPFGKYVSRDSISHAFMAIDPRKFVPYEDFVKHVESLRNYLKNFRKHPSFKQIWVHGEKSYLTMKTRLELGIPIHKSVLRELKEISDELGIEFLFGGSENE